MLKKSVFFISTIMLGFSIGKAEDEVKKPATEEVKKTEVVAKAGKYSIPEKKIEEFSNNDLMDAASYIQGVMVANQLGKEKDINLKLFIQGVEQKAKDPKLTADPAVWEKLIAEYQEVKKANGEISEELKSNLSKNHGINYATTFTQNGFDLKLFLEGFNQKIENKDLTIAEARIKEIGEKLQPYLETKAKEAGEKAKSTNKRYIEGKTFLEANKTKEGVVTLPSGLQYKIINKGEGAVGKDGQVVKVHYTGTDTEGKEFDSSIKRGPFELTLPGEVIKGWQEVLKLMPKGSKWQVFIPEDLAYGAQARGPIITPYSVLIFEMEMVDILADTPPAKKAD